MKKAGSKTDKVRKVFVRNSINPAKSCVVIQDKKRVQFCHIEDDDSWSGGETDFSVPEFCSILKLADDIRKVQLKPNSDLVKRELESMPKQFNLNYQPDEKLYQDLVSVQRPISGLQPRVKSSLSSRFPTKKDPEPNYKELLKYSLQPEYKFTKVITAEMKKPAPEFDGRSIYRLTKRLTVCNIY